MNLSTQELAQLRADAEDYLPDTCTLQTKTETSDSMGGWTESWANTYTSVECRLAPMQSMRVEALEADQLTAASRWILTVHHDQTINVEMRVVHDSVTYEIESLHATHSQRAAKRAVLARVD